MANMSYCRFENTLNDLLDCYNNMDDQDLSDSEQTARFRLIDICGRITDEYWDLDDED